jgi:D-alanyl-D-alanine carboxypeptidase
MQLVEAGKLRLDDTAGSWIPELAEAGSPIASVSVRELVSNSAGVIRDGVDATFWAHGRPFPDEQALLQLVIREGAVHQPEAFFKYSNVGFSLLGVIIGKATGSSYPTYVKTGIIEKLGLRNTGPELDEARLSEYAAAHSGLSSWTERQVIPHISTEAMASATGFYSTADDMARFASAHFFGDERLISDRSKNEMQRPVWTGHEPDAPQDGYGYGTIIQHSGGHRMVGHAGGYPGHITRTIWDPSEGLAISVLTNAIDGPAEELATGILKILDKARETAPKLSLSSGLVNTATIPKPEAPDSEVDLARFTGRFAALWGVLDVCVIGGKLLASSPTWPSPLAEPSELAIVDENTLQIMTGSPYGSVGEHVRYERDSDGTINCLFAGGGKLWPIEDYRSRAGVL